MDNQVIFLLRMVTAVLCGALIGLERSRRQKEAGIRTHIMVTLGATLIVIVSKYGFLDVADLPGVSVDASRIASNFNCPPQSLGSKSVSGFFSCTTRIFLSHVAFAGRCFIEEIPRYKIKVDKKLILK